MESHEVMAEPSERTASVSIPLLLALLGGIAGVVGVFLDWVKVTRVSFALDRLGSQLGVEVPSLPGAPFDRAASDLAYSGRSHVTGLVAGLAALVVIVAVLVAMLLNEPGGRRIGGMVAAGSGILMVAVAIQASLSAGSIAEDRMVSEAVDAVRRELGGALLGFGFLVNQLAGAIKGALEVDAGPSVGLYTAAAGGVAAAAGGLLVGMRPTPAARSAGSPLERVAARLDPGDRAELLRVLTAPPEDRAEEIRRFCEQPGRGSWRDVLAELQRDEGAREDVVDALRRREGLAPN